MEIELPKMARTGVPISYDFSNHGTDMYFRAHCPYITYSILSCGHINERDALALINSIHDYGCPYVIATRGGEGSIFSDKGQAHRHVPQKIQAKDTMGAGDAFLTGFLLSWVEWLKAHKADSVSLSGVTARQEAIERSMEVGARFAAKICMLDGAFGHGAVYSE
jgi:sugar/nucleoside kinase (ribokinase family)